MRVSAVAHLAVPTGTAAATVIAREPFEDASIEARRFARLEALSDVAFRANFEELIVSGVYTVLHGRLLVLRVIGGGTRRFALVARVDGTAAGYPRAGLDVRPRVAQLAVDSAAESGLQALVEGESRQRPVFHGVTPDGVTYSGFAVVHTDSILAALAATLPEAALLPGLTAFVLGESFDFPAGLAVGLEQARE